ASPPLITCSIWRTRATQTAARSLLKPEPHTDSQPWPGTKEQRQGFSPTILWCSLPSWPSLTGELTLTGAECSLFCRAGPGCVEEAGAN
ncbi:hypothetical protein QQF64_014837, partial [Cirrhinus molitorella]